MLEFFTKIILSTLKDSLFCLCLLFLCFNPYSGLSDLCRILVTFFALILYMLLPRILNYSSYEPLINTIEYNKISDQKDTFVATLSHDLKAPVVSQIASLKLLLDGEYGKLNYEQSKVIEANLSSCVYIQQMVLTLLATYQFENGQGALKLEEFDAIKLVEECINEMRNLAQQNNQSFKTKFQMTTTRLIYADRIQIKRVVMNLISNAINYGFNGTKIEIDAINDNGYFRFYIENSSPYIPDSRLQLLFKKFSSPNFRNSKSGTGLGLYLSRKIIEAHGGSIMVESFEDNKNQFSFCIPSENSLEAAEIRKNHGRVMFK